MRFSRTARASTTAAALALATLGLSGCATAASPQASSAPPVAAETLTATASTTPSAAESPAPETGTACTDSTQAAVLEDTLPQVPAYPDFPDVPWVAAEPDRETWDSCAPLSYAVATLEGGTASTPNHILLFHGGKFVGTATADAYGFFPGVQQLSDTAITVTYRYPLPGEPNAAPTGEAVATYAWDEATQSVVMDGELPPI